MQKRFTTLLRSKIYKQIDGVSKVSLLGPILPDILLGYIEMHKLLDVSYVDDTFVLCRIHAHIRE